MQFLLVKNYLPGICTPNIQKSYSEGSFHFPGKDLAWHQFPEDRHGNFPKVGISLAGLLYGHREKCVYPLADILLTKGVSSE